MRQIYDFIVDETYVVPCRYQVVANSEAEARRKAEAGDVVQNEIEGDESLTSRTVGDLVGAFDDDDAGRL